MDGQTKELVKRLYTLVGSTSTHFVSFNQMLMSFDFNIFYSGMFMDNHTNFNLLK